MAEPTATNATTPPVKKTSPRKATARKAPAAAKAVRKSTRKTTRKSTARKTAARRKTAAKEPIGTAEVDALSVEDMEVRLGGMVSSYVPPTPPKLSAEIVTIADPYAVRVTVTVYRDA